MDAQRAAGAEAVEAVVVGVDGSAMGLHAVRWAVEEADRRGDIPGFATPLLRRLVESAPIDRLIRGGISLNNLFG